ncbi:permease prefix domain 1-containing protein [Brachybacterium hainanense]|uniref:Permease prefix domain 1-containing protein n=1 Tax=Brachybacterium hainanense TaxID=1541174 RepID=A0ABV6RB56_9MICO
MNVIDSYLDTLFDPYPRSARMDEARAELRAMMEDKQQSLLDQGLSESQAVGRVIAEFGSLEEVAPELGIAADLGAAAPPGPPRLSADRAREYVDAIRRNRGLVAGGVTLFVLSVVPLLLLIAWSGQIEPEPPGWATLTGLVLLLVLITTGVLMLVVRGGRLEDYADIENGDFTPTAEVRAYAGELRREHRTRSQISFAIALSLWILCAVPILVPALLSEDEDQASVLFGVCLTLLMVAAGLWILLRGAWASSAADTLENEEDPDDLTGPSVHPAIRVIAAVYWPLATAIFLGWSFATGDWGSTWIIWPIAGVLYGCIWAVSGALRTGQDASRR